MVVFGHSGCIRVKVVVFGPILLYSGKSCFNPAKLVVFGQGGCIRAKCCIRAKVVVLGQKWLYYGKSAYIR